MWTGASFVWLLAALMCTGVAGQMPMEGAPVERLRPDVYYLRDASGKLVPVPDLSLEEYQRWLEQQPQGPLPAYAIQNVMVWGRLHEDRVDVEVRVDVRMDRPAADAVPVPLRFSPAILQEYRYEGPGLAAVSFDRRHQSYVLWLRSGPATRHTATFRLVVPVRRSGDQRVVHFELPDALTHIELLVPFPQIEPVVDGEQYLMKAPAPVGTSSSLLELDGYGGPCTVRIRPRTETNVGRLPFLQGLVQVQLVVEDPTYLRVEVQLEVQAEQDPWEKFHLRLPVGMSLQPRDTPGFTVQIVDPGTAAVGPLLAIARTAPSPDRSSSLTLAGEVRRLSPLVPWEAAGFDIPEAYYQRVEMGVRVTGGWSVRAVQTRQVRRVASLTALERQQGIVARFTYVMNRTQPPSLRLLIQPQQSSVAVEPNYYVRFAGQRAWLHMFLRFRVRGAASKGFELWTGDWTIRAVQPQDWLDAEPMPPAADSRIMTVYLDPTKIPGSGNFDLHLIADAPVDVSRTDTLVFPLPIPQASATLTDQTLTVLPAVVVLEAASDVELKPVTALMPELLPAQPQSAEWLIAQLPQATASVPRHVFQGIAGAEPLRLACQLRPRPTTIQVQSEVVLDVRAQHVEVDQRLTFDIQHQPLSSLTLELPAGVAVSALQAELDGQPVAVTVDESMNPQRRWTIPLQPSWSAAHSIRVKYPWPLTGTSTSDTGQLLVPLVTLPAGMPITGAVTSCRWASAAEDISWSIDTQGWQASNGNDIQPGRSFVYQGLPPSILLRRSGATTAQPTIEITRAWIQSVCTAEMRVDRAVFRVHTDAPRLEVRLPSSAARWREEVWVAINGRRWANWYWKDTYVLEIVRDPAETAEVVVEVWYAAAPVLSSFRSAPVELAQLLHSSRLYPSYWELVTPSRYHLMWYSDSLTPHFSWRWQGGFARRVNLLTPRHLEDWTGAVHGPELPTAVNRYVFSFLGSASTIDVQLWGRGWLVLLSSSSVLLLAWVWTRWEKSQRVLLLVMALLLLLAAAWQPDVSILMGQAALLGVIVWMLLQLARWVLVKPSPAPRVSKLSTVVKKVEAESPPVTAATVSAGEVYSEWSSGVQRT